MDETRRGGRGKSSLEQATEILAVSRLPFNGGSRPLGE
jgi:hypothetical protein